MDAGHVSEKALCKIDWEAIENVKKNNSFNQQNNNFARASRFFVHFFAGTVRLRGESA